MRGDVFLLAMVVAGAAWAQSDFLEPPLALERQYIPGFDANELPVGEGGPPESVVVPQPAPPASADQIAHWRHQLIGKSAFSPDGGRVGTVTELTLDVDDRPLAAVVTAEGGARLPVSWYRVRNQLEQPTLVVPWSAADIRWLSGR